MNRDEALKLIDGVLADEGGGSWFSESVLRGIRAALSSPYGGREPIAEGLVELERGNCCRTQADEEGWGHIRVYVGAHWPAPKHSRRVLIFADEEGETDAR